MATPYPDPPLHFSSVLTKYKRITSPPDPSGTRSSCAFSPNPRTLTQTTRVLRKRPTQILRGNSALGAPGRDGRPPSFSTSRPTSTINGLRTPVRGPERRSAGLAVQGVRRAPHKRERFQELGRVLEEDVEPQTVPTRLSPSGGEGFDGGSEGCGRCATSRRAHTFGAEGCASTGSRWAGVGPSRDSHPAPSTRPL